MNYFWNCLVIEFIPQTLSALVSQGLLHVQQPSPYSDIVILIRSRTSSVPSNLSVQPRYGFWKPPRSHLNYPLARLAMNTDVYKCVPAKTRLNKYGVYGKLIWNASWCGSILWRIWHGKDRWDFRPYKLFMMLIFYFRRISMRVSRYAIWIGIGIILTKWCRGSE